MKYLNFLLLSLIAIGCSHQINDTNKNSNGTKSKGEELYLINCAACHILGDEKMVGPGLTKESITKRDRAWLIGFIQHADSMILAGDIISKELYEEYNYIKHPKFSGELSDKDLEELLEFISKQ